MRESRLGQSRGDGLGQSSGALEGERTMVEHGEVDDWTQRRGRQYLGEALRNEAN